LTDTTINIMI